MKDLSRNVSMICSFCGNNMFSTIDPNIEELKEIPEETLFKCSYCGKVISKRDLLEENQEIINANIEEIKEEAVKEFEKELKKALKKIR